MALEAPLTTRLGVAVLTGTGSVGTGLGYAASSDPIVLLTVPAGIVGMGAAVGIAAGLSAGLAEGIRHRLRIRMDVPESLGAEKHAIERQAPGETGSSAGVEYRTST